MKQLMTLLPLVTFLSVTASVPGYLPQGQRYDPSITTPSAYLGYSIGERHMTHAELSGYLRQLERESERIEILDYGRTHGHRPLLKLLISSPANLARQDQLRDLHLQLSQPEKSGRMDLSKMPVVVNLHYGVHGNEASASNSAVVVAYYLAAAEGEAIEDLLDKTIILLDPCLNPDGFDRFSNWVNSRVGRNPNPDPNALEHREPAPDGRTNYYWFDLNRDYMLLTQPESQGRMALYHQWMPNLVMDFHEMETHSTYFFQPGVPSRNNPLTPQSVFDLTTTISHYFSDALDAEGSLYFTEERFDDFYMGKGSTIADLKGAIGILLEQASARGQVQESAHGLLTFEFAIQNQVTISLAALKASRELHGELLEHMRTFFRESLEKGRSAQYAGYRFASPGDTARARAFVEILRAHQIEVHPIDGEDAWYVPVAQPHYLYLQALIEQRTEFEENIFYDITAWTLPLAYNLEWDKLDQAPNRGHVHNPEANLTESSMGYLIDWAGMNAPRILFDLLQEGVSVKVAKEPFTLKGESFGYGTLFIPMSLQQEKAETVYSILKSAAEDWQVRVAPVDTFRTESGIDLGSNSVVPLAKPRILIPVGEGIYNGESGTAWHLIDVLHDYPVTLISPTQLASMDLSKYTALVLPGGSGNAYRNLDMDRLKNWVRDGGTVICLGSSVWAIEQGLVKLELFTDAKEEKEALSERPRRPFSEASDDDALQRIRGALFNTEIDPSHPLLYGYSGKNLPVFRSGTDFLKPSRNRYQTPMVFSENPLLAGYVSADNLEKLAGSAAAVVERQGRGAIILFGHAPTFRAYWRGTEKLLLNAILFGPLMQASDPGAY